MVVGMMSAVLQGAPAVTFDVDLWIDLPARQYIRVLNLAQRLGGQLIANTVVAFGDELTVNFIYAMTGLRSFGAEHPFAEWVRWGQHRVPLLPLERILASKRACGRPKDLAHIPLLERVIASKALASRRRGRCGRRGPGRPATRT